MKKRILCCILALMCVFSIPSRAGASVEMSKDVATDLVNDFNGILGRYAKLPNGIKTYGDFYEYIGKLGLKYCMQDVNDDGRPEIFIANRGYIDGDNENVFCCLGIYTIKEEGDTLKVVATTDLATNYYDLAANLPSLKVSATYYPKKNILCVKEKCNECNQEFWMYTSDENNVTKQIMSKTLYKKANSEMYNFQKGWYRENYEYGNRWRLIEKSQYNGALKKLKKGAGKGIKLDFKKFKSGNFISDICNM